MNGEETYSFEVTDDHMALLKHLTLRWEGCEYGAPAVDCKRPYGNSDVVSDICDILGWVVGDDGPTEAQSRAARRIHEQTLFVLMAFVATESWGEGLFEVATAEWGYDSLGRDTWRRVVSTDAPPLPEATYRRYIR